MRAIVEDYFHIFRRTFDFCQGYRQAKFFVEFSNLITVRVIVAGQENQYAKGNYFAVKMSVCMRQFSIRVIEAVCQRCIVVVFRTTNYQVGNNTSSNDNIQSSFIDCIGNYIVAAIFQSLFAILEQRVSTSVSNSLTHKRSVEQIYTTSCQFNFEFFGHCVTNTCPEKFFRRFCNNFGIDKDMIAATFTVVVTCHATIRFIHYAECSRRSAVGSQGREVEQRLAQFICQNFAAVSSTATTNTKNHISSLYAFFFHEHINIFVGCIATKPFGTNDFQIRTSNAFLDSFGCNGKSSFTANQNDFFAIAFYDGRNFFIAIRTDCITG